MYGTTTDGEVVYLVMHCGGGAWRTEALVYGLTERV